MTKDVSDILNKNYEQWVFNSSNRTTEVTAQDLLDHLKAQPELQPIPRIKSIQADNSLAIKVDEIRAMLERELGSKEADGEVLQRV